MGYYAAARKKQKDDFRQELKASAFTGWQFYTLISGILGSKDKKPMMYLEYSETLGLLNEEEKEHLKIFKELEKIRKKAENQKAKEEGLKKAASIIELDKARREKNSKGG